MCVGQIGFSCRVSHGESFCFRYVFGCAEVVKCWNQGIREMMIVPLMMIVLHDDSTFDDSTPTHAGTAKMGVYAYTLYDDSTPR